MTDFSNSVIMPREDFVELSTAAFDNSHVPTAGERVASSAQAILVMAGISAGLAGAYALCVKAQDWYEERRLKRDLAVKQFDVDNRH